MQLLSTDVMQFFGRIFERQYCLSEHGHQHERERKQNSRTFEVFNRVHKAPVRRRDASQKKLQFMFSFF
jgi:hypothetical protein